MADAGKVLLLGLRKISIENELKEATTIYKTFELIEKNWCYLEEEIDFKEEFRDVAIKYELRKEELEKSLKEAEAEWLEAGEEYKREHGTLKF